jgi:signal transduction histidine kinase
MLLPERDAERAVTPIASAGERVAAIVHDPALRERPELVEAAASMAMLMLDRDRLNIELRASLAELRATQARILSAADGERKRIERDLHDGAQQRFVAARLDLTLLERQLDQPDRARSILAKAREQLDGGLAELRDLARGIHPTVLTDRGLEPALTALVRRASLPVELRAEVPERLDPAIEAAAYFLVSEALTNVSKHAQANTVTVDVASPDGTLVVTISDDGLGGADARRGSGLRGLVDRVDAVGGHLELSSERGHGTRLCARLPANVLGSLAGQRQSA